MRISCDPVGAAFSTARRVSRGITIRPALAPDAEAVARIYNDAILSRSATFETDLKAADERVEWIHSHGARCPILVAESDGDGVVGWTTFAPFSERECYRGIGYFSVYVDPGMRRLGVGRQLLRALVDEARRRGYWKLVSGIFVSNAASRALCAACGWREVGIYQRHAQLDGRWIDVVIVEQLL